jgi:hypothetical protein
MATFDLTKMANSTGFQNGINTYTWTIDMNDTSVFGANLMASTDDIRLLEVKAGESLVFFGSTIEVNRIFAGSSTAVVDFGIDGGAEFDGAVDIKVTAGTITLNDTNAAPVLYTNSGGTSTYVTIEPTYGGTHTDHGKITVTAFIAKVSN